MLDAIDERILISDFGGRLQFLNSRAEGMFGICNRNARRYGLRELLPALDPSALETTGVTADLTLDAVRLLQGGENRFYSVTRRLLWLAGALQSSGFVWVMRDITAERLAQQALSERERFWSEVLRAAPDTLYVFLRREQPVRRRAVRGP